MLKTVFAAATITCLLAFAPAQAQQTDTKSVLCTPPEMAKLQGRADAMRNGSRKRRAQQEITLATDAMTNDEVKMCVMHVRKAIRMVGRG